MVLGMIPGRFWYSHEKFGVDFAAEVYSAIQRIVAHPHAWPVLDDEVRRCQTKRFPYGRLYAEIIMMGCLKNSAVSPQVRYHATTDLPPLKGLSACR